MPISMGRLTSCQKKRLVANASAMLERRYAVCLPGLLAHRAFHCLQMCVCVCVTLNRPYRAYRQGTRPCRAHKSGQNKAGVQSVCVCVCVCVPGLTCHGALDRWVNVIYQLEQRPVGHEVTHIHTKIRVCNVTFATYNMALKRSALRYSWREAHYVGLRARTSPRWRPTLRPRLAPRSLSAGPRALDPHLRITNRWRTLSLSGPALS